MSCYFNNSIKFKLLNEIEKILDNINNTKNNKYIINPIYFYNGYYHNDSCLYTEKTLKKDLLDILYEKFKINSHFLIWTKLYDDVYMNEYTGIIKFTNLNNKSSYDILQNMLSEKKEYLNINYVIMKELCKEYDEI